MCQALKTRPNLFQSSDFERPSTGPKYNEHRSAESLEEDADEMAANDETAAASVASTCHLYDMHIILHPVFQVPTLFLRGYLPGIHNNAPH